MPVIAPGEWFMTDREAIVFFHNVVRHYNSTSSSYEVPNPFQKMLVEIPRSEKIKVRFAPELVNILREAATMLSSFDVPGLIIVNSKGDEFPTRACGIVVLSFLD